MQNIFQIQSKRKFSLQEAQQLLPVVYRVTDESNKELRSLMNKLKALGSSINPKTLELEKQVNQVVEKWNNKMVRLGGKPKGVWLADFDNGQGFYCWKFPETDILHTHGYDEGFTGRRSIGEAKNESSISPN